jgi:hypothetical protein
MCIFKKRPARKFSILWATEPQTRELDARLERAISAADVVNARRSGKSAEETYINIEEAITKAEFV